MSRHISAATVSNYMQLYKDHLWMNNLPDDSDTINVSDLVYFVRENILNEDSNHANTEHLYNEYKENYILEQEIDSLQDSNFPLE